MAEVFLSYAREDSDRAKSLAVALERTGHSVWWDRNIEGGSEYTVEIDQELNSADAVVVLWSAHSVGSAWVRDEAAAGRDTGRLIPVRLDDAEPPLGFRQYQAIDLSRWKGRDGPGLATLKSAVAAKVQRSGKQPAPAPPPVQRRRPRWMLAAVAAVILTVAALAYVWTSRGWGNAAPTITIVRAPSGADPSRSDALARALSIELGTMTGGAVEKFELRDAADGKANDAEYLVEVAATQSGGNASADLSLLARSGRQILWTSHVTQPASAPGDLRLSAATRLLSVLSCLAEASASDERLDRAVLKLHLRGCEKFRDEIGGMADIDQLATLREVVSRAPRFAPAIAHLALIEANSDQFEAARAHIAKAKEIDPKQSKIYLAEVNLLPRSNWRRRQAIIAEGLKRDPNSAALYAEMAAELIRVGRNSESIEYISQARELEPMSPIIRAQYVFHLMNSGRAEAARKELEAAERIWPNSVTLTDMRFAFNNRFGDPKDALRSLRENIAKGTTLGSTVGVRNPGPELFLLARIDPTQRNIDAAEKAYFDRFLKDPADIGSMTVSLGFFGRVDPIFRAMADPVALKRTTLQTNNFFRPFMKPVLRDPRFMPLAARLGLVRYWTETGKWPDFCFESDLPYDCKQEAARLRGAATAR